MCGQRGPCMAGACMVGGMHGRGHAWQGVMRGRGYVWQGGEDVWQGEACVAGGHESVHGRGHGRGVCMACTPPPPDRYYKIQSMSGRYASYWNAFLF